MMGLTLVPLVRALFVFSFMNMLAVLETQLAVLTILLVVSVAGEGVWRFFPIEIGSIGDVFLLVVFVPKIVESKVNRLI